MTTATVVKVAYSPAGFPIRGTLETLRGCADAELKQDSNGQVEFEYTGYTDVWWDEQRTEQRDGETLFVDMGGNECKASEIVFRDEVQS